MIQGEVDRFLAIMISTYFEEIADGRIRHSASPRISVTLTYSRNPCPKQMTNHRRESFLLVSFFKALFTSLFLRL